MDTLLLDQVTWDLVLDADGNIAVASDPYSLAQDAASVIRTYLGEVYFDVTLGVPYLTEILGFPPSLTQLKSELQKQARTVPDVAPNAKVFFASSENRVLVGQVQVTSASTGQTSVATFVTINPQGG
jgi:hypothetical protein